MTPGQRVVAVAERYLGVREKAPNTDFGGFIDRCQWHWGMGRGTALGPQPWCGCGLDAWFREAAVDDDDVPHPSTRNICLNADAKGGLGGTPVPGAIVVWPAPGGGKHTELVRYVRSDGRLACIGANTDDGVKETVRDLREGGRVIVPRAVAAGGAGPLRTRTVFGFEDLHYKPDLFGSWSTAAERDRQARAFVERGELVRKVRTDGPQPFAFEVYRRAPDPQWGERYDFGPWRAKKARDEVMRRRERATGRRMRPYRREIRVLEDGPEPAPGPDPKTT